WLKSAPQRPLTIEISDGAGKMIRTFTGRAGTGEAGAEAGGGRGGRGGFGGGAAAPTAAPGLNRFSWDLRTDPPSQFPGAVYWAGRGGGAVVTTGTYNVKLTVGGQSYTSKFEVKTDPRIKVSQEDLDKQFEFATRLNARITAGHDAINQIRALRQQIDVLKQRLPANTENKTVLDAIDALNKKMTAVEEEMIQTKSTSNEDALNFPIRVVNQLVALFGTVESADAAPTQQSLDVFDNLNKKLTASLAKWEEIQKVDIPDLNSKMSQANIPGVSVPPAGRAGGGGRGGRRGGEN
ncbi:MAG: glycosyl hydrolase, partial [Bryobacteraceae bacterium]